MEWLSLQAFVLVRLVNFHKKMSIQPLGWGAVKTYGFALNWKNRIAALQVLVREYNLQLTAIQHLSETQLGETIFINDWRTCSLSIHSATLKSTPSEPDKHKFWKTTLVLMGMLLQLVEWHFAINLSWVKTQGTDLWNPLVYYEAILMILHYLTQLVFSLRGSTGKFSLSCQYQTWMYFPLQLLCI